MEKDRKLWRYAQDVHIGIDRLVDICARKNILVDTALKKNSFNVYVDDFFHIAVKLDDGTTYTLIRNCPHLIYQLYEAKSLVEKGNTDKDTIRKAQAFDKFDHFFNWMTNLAVPGDVTIRT